MYDKIMILEQQLLEANRKIITLQTDLLKERANNSGAKNSVATTRDETRKYDLESFQKIKSQQNTSRNRILCQPRQQSVNDMSQGSKCTSLKSTKLLGRTSQKIMKKAKSSERSFKNEFCKSKMDTQEDIEFQKVEVQAIYEAKIDKIFKNKSNKESVQEVLQSLNVDKLNKKVKRNTSQLKISTTYCERVTTDIAPLKGIHSADINLNYYSVSLRNNEKQ